MNVYFVSYMFVFKGIPLLLTSPVVMMFFVWCALYVASVSGPPRPAYKFRAFTYIVNRTVEAKFTWKAGYDWKMPQYFELDQKDFDSQIWVEVYKITEESDRSVILQLEHSQKYQFRVRACNIYGCSRSNTPEVQFTTDSTYCIKMETCSSVNPFCLSFLPNKRTKYFVSFQLCLLSSQKRNK